MIIHHNSPTLGYKEAIACINVIRSGIVSGGEQVKRFEDELCRFFGLPEGHVAVLSSGTAALYLALRFLVRPYSSVALPTYACAALRNATIMAKLNPVYVDCGPNSVNLCSSLINCSDVELAIAPSLFGIPFDPSGITGIPVIEDIAQSLGSTVGTQYTGTLSSAGILSFYATKLITSGGQGGAVISKDISLIESIKDFLSFDCRTDYINRFNFTMTEVQAAIGRVQLSRYSELIDKRNRLLSIYKQYELPLYPTHDGHVPYRAILKIEDPKRLKQQFSSVGISSIIPIESYELLDPCYQKHPNALANTQQLLSIPLYPKMSFNQAKYIANMFQALYNR